VSDALKLREAWKYAPLKEVLESQQREFEFEHEVGPYIFDLALLDQKILVEFDGPYHRGENQRDADADKTRVAEEHGFVVVRREVQAASVISPETIEGL
jgi:very-short-patch-repair endonuclease